MMPGKSKTELTAVSEVHGQTPERGRSEEWGFLSQRHSQAVSVFSYLCSQMGPAASPAFPLGIAQ